MTPAQQVSIAQHRELTGWRDRLAASIDARLKDGGHAVKLPGGRPWQARTVGVGYATRVYSALVARYEAGQLTWAAVQSSMARIEATAAASDAATLTKFATL